MDASFNDIYLHIFHIAHLKFAITLAATGVSTKTFEHKTDIAIYISLGISV